MSNIAYINGEFVAADQAKISIYDRGFLFADAIYEVCAVLQGKLIDFPGHIQRLRRSLTELGFSLPTDDATLRHIHEQLISRNALDEGLVYLQVSRGVQAPRNFLPGASEPTVVLFTQSSSITDAPQAKNGIRISSQEDLRWHRRDIKTTQLLWSCMAKMQAVAAGADDAWLVEDGFVTEGSSNNAWIVDHTGALITRPLSRDILAGITRAAVMRYAQANGTQFIERKFTLDEAKNAREAFVTSATTLVWPVVAIDDTPIADGKPGPVSAALRKLYIEESLRHC